MNPACADLTAVQQNAECICDVRSVQVHGGYKLHRILSSLIDKSNYGRTQATRRLIDLYVTTRYSLNIPDNCR